MIVSGELTLCALALERDIVNQINLVLDDRQLTCGHDDGSTRSRPESDPEKAMSVLTDCIANLSPTP